MTLEGLDVKVEEDALYFEGEKEELTVYATVVLCVFVGATVVRAMVWMGARGVVWWVERRAGKRVGGSAEVEKGGEVSVGKGWRGRLEGESSRFPLLGLSFEATSQRRS